MPAPTTSAEFLDLIRKSQVVDDQRLEVYLEQLRADPELAQEPARLAPLLLRDGILTCFQTEQLLAGKWKRFAIGRYKVLERLGAGRMGSVYLCEDKLLRRQVAIKVLPTAMADDTESLKRFHLEARALATLRHPNIISLHEVNQDGQLHFLVLEYVDGATLAAIVWRHGPLDFARAAHYVRQAALGLQHAHEQGLVHRDVEPGNLMLDRGGAIKIIGLGLVAFVHDRSDHLAQDRFGGLPVLCHADYVAPEQARDFAAVDHRADICSLGAIFSFCLAGRTPFPAGTAAQKLSWHQTRQPRPVRSIRPEVPEGLAAVIDRMMAREPAERFQTAAAVAVALEPWTRQPLPPPSEAEMPLLCPAVCGEGGTRS